MEAQKTKDLFAQLAKLIQVCKDTLSDGWQPGSDIPAIAVEVFKDAMPILGDLKGVPAEWASDPVAVAKEIATGSVELGAILISKG